VRGGVGAATAASLPRVLIMASSLRPCAVHHSPRSVAAAGEVRRARSAAARTVVFMSLFPLSNIMLIQSRVRHLLGDRPGKNHWREQA
jgi:hypothetical protein